MLLHIKGWKKMWLAKFEEYNQVNLCVFYLEYLMGRSPWYPQILPEIPCVSLYFYMLWNKKRETNRTSENVEEVYNLYNIICMIAPCIFSKNFSISRSSNFCQQKGLKILLCQHKLLGLESAWNPIQGFCQRLSMERYELSVLFQTALLLKSTGEENSTCLTLQSLSWSHGTIELDQRSLARNPVAEISPLAIAQLCCIH